MDKPSKRGGKRPNSGRPRTKDKKNVGFTVYARRSQIKSHGGRPALKKKLDAVVNNYMIPIPV